MGDRPGAEGLLVQRLGDGSGQFLRTIVIQQRQQADHVRPQRRPAGGQSLKQGHRGGDGDAEPVAGRVRIRLARHGPQPLEMRRILDRVAGAIAAPMARHLHTPVDEPDGGRAGEQGQRVADAGVRNRVTIAIKADVGRLAGAHGAHQVRGQRVRRDGQEPGLFVGEDLGHRPVALVRVAPGVRDLVAPAAKLGIEIVGIAKGPRRKERMAEVLDLSLDLALLIAAPRRTRLGREAVVPGQFQQARMKLNRRAPSIEDRAPQVVIHQRTGDPPEGVERRDMASEKTLERLVEGEEREERARVAQHHHEARDRADAMPQGDRAKRPPIDLGLLPHERDHAAIRAGRDGGAQVTHEAPHMARRPGIAALAEHLVEPGRAQARKLRQGVPDQGEKRIERTRAPRPPRRPGVQLNRAADRVVVDAKRGRDRVDLPVLAGCLRR